MNALEELDNLNDLVPQALRLALKNCAFLDKLAAEARQTAYKARAQVCKDCPHPPQFIASYLSQSVEGRVCRLCGLQESRTCFGYQVLKTISYTEDYDSNHRVEFNVAMSYCTHQVSEFEKA